MCSSQEGHSSRLTPPGSHPAGVGVTKDGQSIVEHVAGAEDFQVAMATYHAARKRWPKAAMTLREGTRVIEDSRRSRIGTLFSFPWSEKGREGGGR
jgi:hypothetical protein